MGIVADFADFVFRSAILNIILCSFLMLLAIEAGLIVGPEVLPCSSGVSRVVPGLPDPEIQNSEGTGRLRFLDVGFSSCAAPTFYRSPVI